MFLRHLNLNRYGSLTSSEQPTETPLEQTPFSYSPRCHHTPAMPRYVEYKNREKYMVIDKKNSLEVFIVTALRSPPQLPQQRQQQKQQPQRGRNTT